MVFLVETLLLSYMRRKLIVFLDKNPALQLNVETTCFYDGIPAIQLYMTKTYLFLLTETLLYLTRTGAAVPHLIG